MKTVKEIVKDKNYTAIDLGNLDELMEYSLIHKINKQKIEGKVFIKDATDATGTEISFNSLAPKAEQPYFHIHKKNEETYNKIRKFCVGYIRNGILQRRAGNGSSPAGCEIHTDDFPGKPSGTSDPCHRNQF